MERYLVSFGRMLMAVLFLAGAMQKATDPSAAVALLTGLGLPGWLVWPAALFNALAGIALILGVFLHPVALALAAYCMITSVFHLVPSDAWQMSIFVKNWAIAGGLLILAAHSGPQSAQP